MTIIENSIKRHFIHHTNYLYMEAVIFKSHIMCWCINHQGRGIYPCLKRYLATLMRSTTTEDDTYLLFEKKQERCWILDEQDFPSECVSMVEYAWG